MHLFYVSGVVHHAAPWDKIQIFSQLHNEGYSLELNRVVSCRGNWISWRKPTYGCHNWIPNNLPVRRQYQILKTKYFQQTSNNNKCWHFREPDPNIADAKSKKWIIWSEVCRGQNVLKGEKEPLLHYWFDLSCRLHTLKTHHCYFWSLHTVESDGKEILLGENCMR